MLMLVANFKVPFFFVVRGEGGITASQYDTIHVHTCVHVFDTFTVTQLCVCVCVHACVRACVRAYET